jgi:hypothetical protein
LEVYEREARWYDILAAQIRDPIGRGKYQGVASQIRTEAASYESLPATSIASDAAGARTLAPSDAGSRAKLTELHHAL